MPLPPPSSVTASAAARPVQNYQSARPQSKLPTISHEPIRHILTHIPSHKGLGTVFLQGGAAGSCGQVHPDSSHIVAISNFFQKNESPGPKCGQKIQVLNTGSNDGVGGKGKSVTVTVADTCPSCDENHLDLSVGAWNTLTGNAPFGTVNINW